MLNRTKIVDELVNEGFSNRTLSSFSDSQIILLGKKILSEKKQSEIMFAQAALQARAEKLKDAFDSGMLAVQKAQEALGKQTAVEETVDVEGEEAVKTVDTDNIGNPDINIKKPNKKKEKLITDKDDVEEDVTSEMVENWMTQVINKKNKPLTKSKLIEMVKNIEEDDIGGMTSDPEIMRREYGGRKKIKHAPGKVRYGDNPKPRTKLFSSVEQEYAFEQLNKYVLDLDGYQIMVDELERGEDPEESILNLFLASDAGFTWDIMIYTDGNIYMDGAPIQDSQDLEEEIREKESGGENFFDVDDLADAYPALGPEEYEDDDRPDNWRELPGYNPDYFYGDDSLFGKEKELAETERDTEGAYMGAPVGTEMPVKTPVRTPTTTPTTPKRRRGPFTRPSVKPKPKAGKEDMPKWMNFADIKSQTES